MIRQRLIRNIVVTFLIFVYGVIAFMAENLFIRMEDRYLDDFSHEIDIDYHTIINSYHHFADMVYDLYITDPETVSLFKDGIEAKERSVQDTYRKQLYMNLLPVYEYLVQHNFRQLHFHDRESNSFLRFHRPDTYGDSLVGIRDTVMYVNSTHEPVASFEEGRIYNGYRFVYPLGWEGDHLGSVEISISMHSILDELDLQDDTYHEFIIRRDVVESKVFDDELSNYTAWCVSPDYYTEIAAPCDPSVWDGLSDRDRSEILKNLDSLKEGGEENAIFTFALSDHSIVSAHKIVNMGGDAVAFVLSRNDQTGLDDIVRLKIIYRIIFTLILIMLIVFIIISDKVVNWLDHLLKTDPLTKTTNRIWLNSRLEKLQRAFLKDGTVYSAIIVDIDHFKHVNDTYGHMTGDTILTAFAAECMDFIGDRGSVSRFGGEEFVILLQDTDTEQAAGIAEGLRSKVEQTLFEGGHRITFSAGVASIEESSDTGTDLLILADRRLYTAKDLGRNRVCAD